MPRHAVVLDEARLAEVVAGGIVIVVVGMVVLAVGRLGARPIEPGFRAGLFLAIHQRQRRRRLIGAADNGQKLKQMLRGLGLRQNKVSVVSRGERRG